MTSAFNYDSVVPRGLSVAQQREIAAAQAQAAAMDRPYRPPTTKPFPSSASLYVGELDPTVQESHLYEIFNAVGPVESIRVCRDAITRRSLGYAFVNFKTHVDGERALSTLNSTSILGKPCRIMWSQRDIAKRKVAGGNIFVKNLDPSITSKSLRDTFAQYGNIISCKVVLDPQGQSKGYGFVHYDTMEAAENAIRQVNGTILYDRELFVGHHIPKRERQQHQQQQQLQQQQQQQYQPHQHRPSRFTNVYVKNLMPDIKEEELKELFSGFGPIVSVLIQRDEMGNSKGFGFVNFERHDDAERAVMQMNDTEYIGRRLVVSRAQKKSERERDQEHHPQPNNHHDSNNHSSPSSQNGNGIKHHRYQGMNLYIKNLDDQVDDQRLRDEFSRYGTITSAKVMREDKTGHSKGFGFVCFTTTQDASKAVAEMNGRMIASKSIYVAPAQRKEDRRNQEQHNQQQQQQQQQHRQLHLQQPFMPVPGYPHVYYDYSGYPQTEISPNRPPPPPPQVRYATAPPVAATTPFLKQGYPVPVPTYYMPSPTAPNHPAYPPQSPSPHDESQPPEELSMDMIESYSPETQNQILGERIYAVVKEKYPEEAGKVTGMLLEMDKEDLVPLVNERDALESKADEAVAVLEEHRAGQSTDE